MPSSAQFFHCWEGVAGGRGARGVGGRGRRAGAGKEGVGRGDGARGGEWGIPGKLTKTFCKNFAD